jgi:pimeloyl-ACP methyl ester carboxylesterase
LPILLPPDEPEESAAILEVVDGLIFSGGGDLDPATYNGSSHPAISGVDPNRDALELTLFQLGKNTDIAMLGICRGLAVMSVASGGSLIFCLVHGACQGTWCWDLLTPQLEARGYKTLAMDLPIEDPCATLSDFADAVVQALPENSDDVILVGHSMAGTVIPIVATQRRVRKLVFLAALIPYPQICTLDQFYDQVDSDTLKSVSYEPPQASKFEQFRDEPDMYNPVSIGKNPSQSDAIALELFFHDCEPDVARWAISKMRNQQSMAYIYEVNPLQALPDVECSYIVCADDRIISPTWSRYAARKRLGVDAIELPGGHCPHLSRAGHLANVLLTVV